MMTEALTMAISKGEGGGPPTFNPWGFLSRGDLVWVGKPGVVERQENFGGGGGV